MDLLLGAALGVVVVVLFLGSTPLLLTPMVTANPQLSMATAVLFYGAKVVAVVVLLLLLFDVGGLADHVSTAAFGGVAAATSVAWTTAALVRFRHDRTPTYDLDDEA